MAKVEDKVLIIMSCGAENPRRCVPCFVMAKESAGQGCEVSFVFTGEGTGLLQKGLMDKIYANGGPANARSLKEFVLDAHGAGVRFFVCGASLDLHGMTDEHMEDFDGDVEVVMVGIPWILKNSKEAEVVWTF